MRMRQAKFLRLFVHQLDEAFLGPADRLGQHDRRVVAGLDDDAADQVLDLYLDCRPARTSSSPACARLFPSPAVRHPVSGGPASAGRRRCTSSSAWSSTTAASRRRPASPAVSRRCRSPCRRPSAPRYRLRQAGWRPDCRWARSSFDFLPDLAAGSILLLCQRGPRPHAQGGGSQQAKTAGEHRNLTSC